MSKIFEIVDFSPKERCSVDTGLLYSFSKCKGKNKFCQYNIAYNLYNSKCVYTCLNIHYASGQLWTNCCGDKMNNNDLTFM